MSNENSIQLQLSSRLLRYWALIQNNETLWFCVFFVIAALLTVGALTASAGNEDVAGIALQVDGSAYRPYVYRQLVPILLRFVSAISPRNEWVMLEEMGAESALGLMFEQLNRSFVLNILSSIINLVSLFGFAYIFRTLLQDQLAGPKIYFNITTAFALYGLAYMNHEGVYTYDYPLLFLYSASVLLISRRNWRWYYPVFILATINKETAILLIGVYMLAYWNDRNFQKFTFHMVLQLFLYILITFVIRYYFSSNPGAGVEVHFLRNLRLLANPPDMYDLPLLLLVLFALVSKDWNSKPVLFKYMLVMIVPLLGLGFAFGWIEELRDYYEVYPAVIAMASMPIATYLFGISLNPVTVNADL